MTTSIRTFLLINLLLSVTLITSLAVVGNLFLEHRDLQGHLDAQLTLVGLTIQSFASNDVSQQNLKNIQAEINRIPKLSNEYFFLAHKTNPAPAYEKVQFQVWDKDGKLLLHSASVPIEPLSSGKIGFSDKWLNEKPWRVFTTHAEDSDITVVVAEQYDFREELEGRITQDSIFIMLLTFPFLGLLIWLIVGRGLDSVRRVTDEVRHRAPTYLEPVDLKSVPIEIQPLIDELNKLFLRLREAFQREKRFAADAAHELRTPLAAISTQVQVAMNITDEKEREKSLVKILAGVDRSVHVVQQLLTLSRTLPEAGAHELEEVNVTKQTTQVVAEMAPAALYKNTEIEVEAPDTPALIMGNPTALGIMIRNLVDNAIRYTPEGSNIKVCIKEDADKVKLIVSDNGPGIPEELRERVFERFFRVLGNASPGSGLGLGIVAQIASIHNADVKLGTSEWGHGLEVTVTFERVIT